MERTDHRPSTCASAASAWGNQNVISIARYRSIAAANCSTGLFHLSRLAIQRAKAEVAVRLERAHAQLLGEGEGLLVVGFGLRDIREGQCGHR